MDWFNMIKRFHERGFWNDSMVGDAVVCEKITAEQYKQITGLDYQAPGQEPAADTEVK